MSGPVLVGGPDSLRRDPGFCGTRAPCHNLLDYLEAGDTIDEFLEQFPTVTREMAIEAFETAKESLLARIG